MATALHLPPELSGDYRVACLTECRGTRANGRAFPSNPGERYEMRSSPPISPAGRRSKSKPGRTMTPVPTDCPKLRLVRDLLYDEQVAKVHNDRVCRQQSAIDRWRAAPAKTGNSAFFQLGVDLRAAGLAMAEVESVLRQEAGSARSPTDRGNQIKGIMRTLRAGLRTAA
jgi:hypothetical protein